MTIVSGLASWLTVLAVAWLLGWTLSHDGFLANDAEAAAGGQLLAAVAWMRHFLIWNGVICKRLNGNRAADSVGPRHALS